MSDIRFNRWLHQSGTGGVYQDSTGSVGIGTSVPTSLVDIQGGNLKIGNQIFTATGVSTFTSGLNVTSGLVGIGTNNPGVILDVRETKTAGSAQIRLYNTDTSDTTTQTAEVSLTPDSRGLAGAGIKVFKENADFSTNADRDISLALNVVQNNSQTEVVRINSDGNVGIGTDNPAHLLHLEGSSPIIQFEDTDNAANIYSLINGGGSAGRLLFQVDPADEGNDSHVRFDIDGSEKARIIPDGAGQLLVGTTVGVGSTTQNIQVLQQILAPQGIIGDNGGWSRVPDRLATRTNAGDLINNHTIAISLEGIFDSPSSNGSAMLFVTFTMRRGNSAAAFSQKSQYMGLWHVTRQSDDLIHVDANNLVTNNMTIDSVAGSGADTFAPVVTMTFDTVNVRSFQDVAIHFCTQLSNKYPGTTA